MQDIDLNENTIRLIITAGIFSIMALWEIVHPKRKLSTPKGQRWFSNLAIIITNSLIVRFAVPVLPVAMAGAAQKNNWGILNHVELPGIIEIIIAIVILDLVIYLQHLLFHIVPAFWRLHIMHHADLDIDVTTGLRFHPIEILVSLLIKFLAIFILGPSPFAVLCFEIILNGTAMFNHGNVQLHEKIDRIIRLFLVTPDMHRVHHSVIIKEMNSNYGFNLPWWDRIFRTYNAQPTAGHEGMAIGLARYREPEKLKLFNLLVMPFTGNFRVVPKKRKE